MTYLIDTSALVRVLRRQAAPHWFERVRRGLVAVCEPVVVETLTMADAKAYQRAEKDLNETYPWVSVPDDAWDVIRMARRELAVQSQHQGLSVADYLVVATGLRHKLVVVHEDADFETVSRYVPQFRQERLGGPDQPLT